MSKTAAEFSTKYSATLEPGMQIEAANKSLVIRISVPSVSLEAPFEIAEPAVREALAAAVRLLNWYQRYAAAGS